MEWIKHLIWCNECLMTTAFIRDKKPYFSRCEIGDKIYNDMFDKMLPSKTIKS